MLWPIATGAALLLALTWVGHRTLRGWMVEQRAGRLRAQAKPTIDRRLEHLDGLVDLPELAAILVLDLTTRGTSAAVLARSGTVLARSANSGDAPAVPGIPAGLLDRVLGGDPHVTWTTEGPDDGRLLVVLVPPLAWLPEPPAIVALATDLGDDERVLDRLGLVLGTGVLGCGWLAVALELAGGGALNLLALAAVPIVLVAARRAVATGSPPHIAASVAPAPAVPAADFTQAMRRVEAGFLAQRASEERMRRFVADASHELRTPLTSLAGAADVLLRGAKDEPAHAERVARVIQTQAQRMTCLVEDLLTLARLDAGTELARGRVALDALVTEHAEELELAAPGRTVNVHAAPATVDGDDGGLRQVLTNLTANALRHTRRHGTITLRVGTDQGRAQIVVADDGEGIAPAELPRIFERFFRGDDTRAGEGSGLGLAIVCQIVQAHDGKITATSRPGVGTTFTVTLPLAASADAQVAVSAAPASPGTVRTMPITTPRR